MASDNNSMAEADNYNYMVQTVTRVRRARARLQLLYKAVRRCNNIAREDLSLFKKDKIPVVLKIDEICEPTILLFVNVG